MKWSNVRLILAREIRDQLRDRRTMFMIVVLPILVYPLLGMTVSQLSQFADEQPTRVLVLGAAEVPSEPPLFERGGFAADLFQSPKPLPFSPKLLALDFAEADAAQSPDAKTAALRAIREDSYDAVLYFPPEFGRQLDAFGRAIRQRPPRDDAAKLPSVPAPEIVCTSAKEKSQLAMRRLFEVLGRWRQAVARANLEAAGVPPAASMPFGELIVRDTDEETSLQGAAAWSKILPLMLVLWAMTGAFYPAVDLCAGEKERGTLETLLSSPARRSEIVLGKLVTIMLFSAMTALLNLGCIAILGGQVMGKMPGFATPSAAVALWLLLALVPVSAVFSALALALAAFARSTKEGQYYLMPLLLVTMPLAVLPVAAGMELKLGTSLIPITGMILLLRTAMEGNYLDALQFLLPVATVTAGCCFLAICWAIELFNSETVLFREGERVEFTLRLRRLLHDRRPTPTVAWALCCGVLILLLRFFLSIAVTSMPSGFRGFAQIALTTQFMVIALPAVLMTVVFTRSPRQTLLLRWPCGSTVPAAIGLAIAIHPVAGVLRDFVMRLHPLNEQMLQLLRDMQEQLGSASLWQVLGIMALLPAVCEELAFRGFILSGFRHSGHKWRAIVYSAVFFGLSHAILQQSMVAVLLGLVLGLVAVQSGSILPGIVFHLVHNSLGILSAQFLGNLPQRWPAIGLLVEPSEDGQLVYRWPVVVAGAAAAAVILVWFQRLPAQSTTDESP